MMTLRWSPPLREKSRLAFAWGLVLALGVTPAMAQSAPGNDPQETARRLYDEGIKHYNVAEYDKAIANFRQAYLLTNASELLFDIAQSYRLRGPGNCRVALPFYRNFLRVEPKTPRRASVEAAIADMERCAQNEPLPASAELPASTDADARGNKSPPARAEEPTTPPSVAAPTESQASPAPPAPARSALPIALGGAGLGLALTGGSLLVWSRFRYDAISADGCAPSCDPSRTDTPRAAQSVGGVVLGVGAALAVAGVVIWIFQSRHDSSKAAAIGAIFQERGHAF